MGVREGSQEKMITGMGVPRGLQDLVRKISLLLTGWTETQGKALDIGETQTHPSV